MDSNQSSYYKYYAAFGSTTINKINNFKIFLFGLRGLGCEIAKNLVLAHSKLLTIQDDELVRLADLGSNSFLRESDVKKLPRSDAVLPRLRELDPSMDIQVHKGDINMEFIRGFHLVIFTDYYSNLDFMFEVDKFCRSQKKPIGFIYAGCVGAFGFLFNDFGNGFKIFDEDGETSKPFAIEDISKSGPGVVTLDSTMPHKYADGDYVSITGVQGMTEINGPEPRPVKIISQYGFSVEDTREFAPYKGGGAAERVKIPKTSSFKSLEETLTEFYESEYKAEWETGNLITKELFFNLKFSLYVLLFNAKFHGNGKFPKIEEEAKIQKIVDSVKNVMEDFKLSKYYNSQYVLLAVKYARCQLAPVTSVFGALVALEAIKFAGKFTPMKGIFILDVLDCLPDSLITKPTESIKEPTRFYDIKMMLGKDLFDKMSTLKILVAGAGVTSSEYLKNLALMGFCSDFKGKVTVADAAEINACDIPSTLPYSKEMIGKSKVGVINEELQKLGTGIKPITYSANIDGENQQMEEDSIWFDLDLIIAASDYRLSKQTIKTKSIWFEKPMFTAMAHGVRCTSVLSIPFLTEAYQEIGHVFSDKFEDSIIDCFPFISEHNIAWSKRIFKKAFVELGCLIKDIAKDNQILAAELDKPKSSLAVLILKEYLLNPMSDPFQRCIMVGKFLFKHFFNVEIQNLLNEYPATLKLENLKPFWSGYKKKPTPLELTHSDELALKFIFSTAKILAHTLKISSPDSLKDITTLLKMGLESEDTISKKKILDEAAKLEYLGDQPGDVKLESEGPLKNSILDFLWTATNLRSRCYTIHELPRYKVEKLALRVKVNVPIVISIIVGLSCIEILKWLQRKPLESYKNYFLNFAINNLGSEPPQRPKKKIIENHYQEFTTWDKIILVKDDKVRDLITAVKNKYGGPVKSLYYKSILLYQVGGQDEHDEDKTILGILSSKVPNFETIRAERKSVQIEYTLKQEYATCKTLPLVKVLL